MFLSPYERRERQPTAKSTSTFWLDFTLCPSWRSTRTSPSLRIGTVGTLVLQRLEKIFRKTSLAQMRRENLSELSPEEEAVDKEDNEHFEKIFKEVGDSMGYQVLHFAIPMETRRTQEVCGAVQRLYLQLRAEGLPLVRLHSDHARELRTPILRDLLRARDVLQTTGEAQSPESNRKAERIVKALKIRAKTLLRASGLPKTCWTLAMVFAVWQQRDCALGRGKQVLPFGAPQSTFAARCLGLAGSMISRCGGLRDTSLAPLLT